MWPFSRRKEQRDTLGNPSSDLFDALGGERTIAGERVDVTSSLAIADVFSACSIITETVATLPLKVYRQIDGAVTEASDHRAYRMLHSAPNPVVPAHRFWATATGHLLLWGNVFVEKLRNEAGLVSELWLMHPSCVSVEWSSTRQKRFTIWDGATKRTLDDDRVLHIYGFSTDGLIGLSPIQQARQQLGIAKGRERFEAEVYAQQPFLTGVITHPGAISDSGVKLRESWSAIYGGGSSSRHSVGVLEEGATYTQLSAPLEDMQFVESQNMSKRTIAALFKIPPAYIGGSTGDSLTYQTVESNQIQLARQAIAPVTTNIAKFLEADAGIFPFSSWYPEFVLEGLLRGDSGARADFYKTMHEIGAITVNEIRERENMAPLDEPVPTPIAVPDPNAEVPA